MKAGNEEALVTSPFAPPGTCPPFPQVGEAMLPTLWEVNINQKNQHYKSYHVLSVYSSGSQCKPNG